MLLFYSTLYFRYIHVNTIFSLTLYVRVYTPHQRATYSHKGKNRNDVKPNVQTSTNTKWNKEEEEREREKEWSRSSTTINEQLWYSHMHEKYSIVVHIGRWLMLNAVASMCGNQTEGTENACPNWAHIRRYEYWTEYRTLDANMVIYNRSSAQKVDVCSFSSCMHATAR